MKFMSETRQQALVDAVTKAAEDHMDGTSATEAIVKAAQDIEANPNEVQRMVESFNTSKHLAHHQDSDPEKRADSFELADYDDAVGVLFPEKGKVVAAEARGPFDDIVPDYFKVAESGCGGGGMSIGGANLDSGRKKKKKKTYAKKASEDLIDVSEVFGSENKVRKIAGKIERLRQHGEAFKTKVAQCNHQVRTEMKELADGFRTVSGVSEWPKFAAEIGTIYGDEGVSILAEMVNDFGLGGVISRHGKTANVVLDDVIDDSSDMHLSFRIIKAARELAVEYAKEADARFEAYHAARESELGIPRPKAASLMSIVGLNAAMSALEKNEAPKAPIPTPEVDLNADKEVENARLQIAMRDMMDDDEIIGTHAPGEVMQMAKELTQVAPGLLDKPLALQGALRRQLELGTVEPHELKQYQDLGRPMDALAQPQKQEAT